MPNEDKIGDEELAELPEVEEGEEDITDYKTLAFQHLQSAKRFKKLLDKERLNKKVEEGVEKEIEKKREKTGFDYGQLAFLETKGVPEEDHDYLLKEANESGKELKEVLKFKYVQEELKSMAEERAAKNAIPTSKRSSGAANNEVEYWIAKGEMPLRKENPELFRKIRKERERLELAYRENPRR